MRRKGPSTVAGNKGADILAFGAHPDDVEFGCGGILVKEARAGRVVHVVVCSRGEAGTNGTLAVRTREAEAAARIMGTTLEFIDLGGDGHFEASVKHALQISRIIRLLRPRILLAPTLTENQHPDHAALGKMVRNAARLARFGGMAELRSLPAHAVGSLLFYAITADAEPRDQQALLFDVSKPEIFTAWTNAMSAHASQMKTRNYLELQLARARVCGLRAGTHYALPLFANDPLVLDSLPLQSARAF